MYIRYTFTGSIPTRSEIRMGVIKQIKKKIEALILPRRHAVIPVLIHLGDVSDIVRDAGFFYRIVDVGTFLEMTT